MVIAAPPCQCGCKTLTGWARRTQTHKGYRRGDPLRFLESHNHQGRPQREQEPAQLPVAPLREAFEASGMTASAVAIRLGWFDVRGFADGPRVRRTLGLKSYPPGHGYPSRFRTAVKTRTAVRLADALGLLPVEIGL